MKMHSRSFFRRRPVTRMGKWAAGLMIAFAALYLIISFVIIPLRQLMGWVNLSLPFQGILVLMLGMSSGVTALIALLRERERSWLVWLALLPGAAVLFFLVGEFLFPH